MALLALMADCYRVIQEATAKEAQSNGAKPMVKATDGR